MVKTLANELPWKFRSDFLVLKEMSKIWCQNPGFKPIMESRIRRDMSPINYDRVASKYYNILNNIQPLLDSVRPNKLIILDNFVESTPYTNKASMNNSEINKYFESLLDSLQRIILQQLTPLSPHHRFKTINDYSSVIV